MINKWNIAIKKVFNRKTGFPQIFDVAGASIYIGEETMNRPKSKK